MHTIVKPSHGYDKIEEKEPFEDDHFTLRGSALLRSYAETERAQADVLYNEEIILAREHSKIPVQDFTSLSFNIRVTLC